MKGRLFTAPELKQGRTCLFVLLHWEHACGATHILAILCLSVRDWRSSGTTDFGITHTFYWLNSILVARAHGTSTKKDELKVSLFQKDILQSNWLILFKNIKAMKDKKRLKDCSRLKETRETRQLNASWQAWIGSSKIVLLYYKRQ